VVPSPPASLPVVTVADLGREATLTDLALVTAVTSTGPTAPSPVREPRANPLAPPMAPGPGFTPIHAAQLGPTTPSSSVMAGPTAATFATPASRRPRSLTPLRIVRLAVAPARGGRGNLNNNHGAVAAGG